LQAFFTKAKGSEPELVTEFDEHGSPIGGSLNPKQAAVLLAEALGEDWTALQEEFAQLWFKGFGDCEAPDPDLLEKVKKSANKNEGRPALPEIIIRGGSLATNATEGEDALIAARVPIYVYAEELQRPIVAEVEASKGRRTSRCALCRRHHRLHAGQPRTGSRLAEVERAQGKVRRGRPSA
jgi:hypothetical protein